MNWKALYGAALTEERQSVRVLGIDLGTTYSTVSRIEWSGSPMDEPRLDVVPIRQDAGSGPANLTLVPSVVSATDDGQIAVGEAARSRRRRDEDSVIGRDYFEATKNDIGTSKRYPHGRSGLTTPTDVAARILRFIMDGVAERFPDEDYDEVVVTVPASFQLNQREETLKAVYAAGVVGDSQLLDEPLAAMLTWLGQQETDVEGLTGTTTVVLDFGGGTCDVALLAHGGPRGHDIDVVGTSRYCRLGGTDIDRALAAQHLLPRLAAWNGVRADEWSYQEKAAVLIPRLAEVAEELKLKLNRQMLDQRRIGRPFDDVEAKASRDVTIQLRQKTLRLPTSEMVLTAKEFGLLLDPYVDQDDLAPSFGEYYETTSIFFPVTELLERTGLGADGVDRVLLAGGSAFLAAVPREVEAKLGVEPTYVTAPDTSEQQTEISQGAALQALALAVTGSPLVQIRSGEALFLRHTAGTEQLVPADVELPWHDILPETRTLRLSDARKPLQLDLLRADVALTSVQVPVPPGSQVGDEFELAYGLDAGGMIHGEVIFTGGKRATFAVERPGSFVANPGVDREEILLLEADLRQGDDAEHSQKVRKRLSTLYRKVGHRDKAIGMAEIMARKATGNRDRATAAWLKATALSDSGDVDAAVAVYRSAIDRGAEHLRFNLAYLLSSRRRYADALDVLDPLVERDGDGPELALRGDILQGLGRRAAAAEDYRSARIALGHPRTASLVELSWIRHVAKQLGDQDLLDEVGEVLRRAGTEDVARGALPLSKEG
ncbi:Hsp70 family protein [Cellulosimicrobium cellulans]|uniref:Hsp70 family protein n=1 Tax=Cellulosimicrobium cellulans TaxID=1710 RepID=UPI003C5E7B29